MPKHDIIVIGASAGGVMALGTILSGLPKEFPASIFITLHTHPTGPGYLAEILGADCSLPVRFPGQHKEEIQPGHVYVAPPNLHLIIKRGYVQERFLPKENGTRPSIDPMFRSAAHAYSRRVIGVLLTGNLDDGTAGMGIIKDEGGITIVQDPKDAEHPDMPLSAIRSVKPDYIVPLAEIAPLLRTLADTDFVGEAAAEETETRETGQVMTCPGCGGVLHQYHDDKVIWFQCRVGHRFTSETMMLEQNTAVEEHLWRMMSVLKEKEDMAKTMAADARASSKPLVAAEYYEEQARAAAEAYARIDTLLNELGPLLFPAIPQEKGSKMDTAEGSGD